MKRNVKKLFLALTLGVCFFSIIACNNDSDTPESSSITTQTQTSTSTPTSEPTSNPTSDATSTPTSEATSTPTSNPTSESSSTSTSTPTSSTDPNYPDAPVSEEDVTKTYVISTIEHLQVLSSLASAEAKYVLDADLDFTGVTIETPACIFKGEFDGQGHTIKNLVVLEGGNKAGLLFAQVVNGSVSNLKFNSCGVTSTNESPGIVAGLCEGGNFKDIEFANCSVETSNNYAGFLYARNTLNKVNGTDVVINIEGITVKSGSFSKCTQYGGVITGDHVAGTTINFKNIDVNATFTSSGNGAVIGGRDRGATSTFENVIIRKADVSTASIGLLTSGNTACDVSYKNVVILNTTSTAPWTGKGSARITYDNCYMVGSTATANYEVIANADAADATWLQNTLNLDMTAWEIDNETLKLKSSSPNTPTMGATIVSIKISATKAKTRFIIGEAFNASSLAVTATYSDGVQILLDDSLFEIDYQEFDKNAVGTYKIKVEIPNTDIVEEYSVTVVSLSSFAIYDEFTVKTYVIGNDISYDNLVVKGVYSDGVQATTTAYSKDTTFDKTKAGEYTVTITLGEFEAKTYTVSVIDTKPQIVNNYLYISVDKNYAGRDGALVDGIETFKTITAAVDYLAALKLDSNINKVIYLTAGTYTEKVTIPQALTNLFMIGEGQDNTKLEYGAAAGHKDPAGNNWGTQGSATLTVKAAGFFMANMQVNNTFDYYGEITKVGEKLADTQGVAVVVEADQVTFYKVTMLGNQDTLYAKSGRQYYKECYIAGNVDFIFGNNAPALFEDCTIHIVYRNATNNGYITAAKGTSSASDDSEKGKYGYVFLNCNLTADANVGEGTVSLGRPWGKLSTIAYINCEMGAHISKNAYSAGVSGMTRWYEMSGNAPQNADFVEYGTTGAGAITTAVNGGSILTKEVADTYTIENIFAAKNGNLTFSAAWNPTTKITALESFKERVVLTSITLSSEKETLFVDDEITLVATINPFNAENKEVTWDSSNKTVATVSNGKVIALAAGTTTITVTCGAKSATCEITVSADAKTNVVSFVTNGAAEIIPSKDVIDGRAVDLSDVNVTKDGYVFIGWYTDEALTKAFDTETLITEATTLYAKWTAHADIPYSNVTYIMDGTEGNNVNSFSYDGNNQGKTAETPATWYGLNIYGAKLTFSATRTQMNAATFIKFNVKAGAVVTLVGTTNALKFTINNGTEYIGIGSMMFTEDSEVLIECTVNGYLTHLIVEYPSQKNINYSFDKNETAVAENNEYIFLLKDKQSGTGAVYFNGLTIDATSGKISSRGTDAQVNVNTTIQFLMPARATVEFKVYKIANWTLDGEAISDAVTTKTYDEATLVTLKCTGNDYLYYINITTPDPIPAVNKTWQFKGEAADATQVSFANHAAVEGDGVSWEGLTLVKSSENSPKIQDNKGGDGAQFNVGKYEFDVAAGAIVTVIVYPSYGPVYSVNGGEVQEKTTSVTTIAKEGKCIIDITTSGYLYSISVSYPEPIQKVNKTWLFKGTVTDPETTVTLEAKAVFQGTGASWEGITLVSEGKIRDNNGNGAEFGIGTYEIDVLAGAVVTLVDYSGAAATYTINGETTNTYTFNEDGKCTIVVTGAGYFNSISVTYNN